MAFQATSWAWSLEIPFGKKIVLLALADMADENFSCFPGQRRLSRMASMSVSTVARALDSLEEDGLIRREERQRPDGSRTSDRFYLLVGPPFNLTGGPLSVQGGSLQDDGAKNLSVESKNTTQRASQLPPDLAWDNGHSVKALAKGVDVDVEFEKFKDYHLARGSKFVDWSKAFHTWLNNARPDLNHQRAGIAPRKDRDTEIREFLSGNLGLDEQRGIA